MPFGGNFDFDQGMEEIQQPFASAAFANLLIHLAPTLQILELTASGGATTIANDLLTEPHSGNLDFAIGQCLLLKRVYLPWSVSANGFLAALSRSHILSELTMVGNATHTSARDISRFCDIYLSCTTGLKTSSSDSITRWVFSEDGKDHSAFLQTSHGQ